MKYLKASVHVENKKRVECEENNSRNSFYFKRVITACDCVKKLIIQEEFFENERVVEKKEKFQNAGIPLKCCDEGYFTYLPA